MSILHLIATAYLIAQLGLETVSQKKGKRGEQTRYYRLAKEDATFALFVLQY